MNNVSTKEDKSGVLSYKNSTSKALKCSETLKIESIWSPNVLAKRLPEETLIKLLPVHSSQILQKQHFQLAPTTFGDHLEFCNIIDIFDQVQN